jgi:hypothetical protein
MLLVDHMVRLVAISFTIGPKAYETFWMMAHFLHNNGFA